MKGQVIEPKYLVEGSLLTSLSNKFAQENESDARAFPERR
jgi:hypothetical protein